MSFTQSPRSDRSLPLPSRQAQLWVGIALAGLMVATRGQHVASIHALPSASWAVFFLAGALLRPAWLLPALFVLASLVDFASMPPDRIGAHCLSPAYWLLLPAYATLWTAGRLYARLHTDSFATVLRLAAVLVVATIVAYQFSGGGFYLFSGTQAEPTLAGYVARVLKYAPQRLTNMAGYVAAAFALRAVWRLAAVRTAAGSGARA